MPRMVTVAVTKAGSLQSSTTSVWNASQCVRSSVTGVGLSMPFSSRLATAKRTFHTSKPLNSKPRMSYRIAVSSSGKSRQFHPDKNVFSFDPDVQDALGIQRGRNIAQRKMNRPDSGEDAFFVSKVGHDSKSIAFGVADGVGGWTEAGVDPANFSHGLCSYMAQSALGWQSGEKLRGKYLMQLAFDQCLNDRTIFAGGSTASIGIADDDGKVELSKYDSGVVIRALVLNFY